MADDNGNTETERTRKSTPKYSTSAFPEPGKLEIVYTKGNGSVTLDVAQFPRDIMLQLAAFGLNAYVTAAREEPADYDDCKGQDNDTVQSLMDGEFIVGRTANGGLGVSQLSRALAELAGKPDTWTAYRDQAVLPIYRQTLTNADSTPEEKARAKVARQQLAALRNNEQVKPILARIEMEDARKRGKTSGVDLAALLGGVQV